MNTVRRFTIILAGVAATCVLSSGVASARVPPVEPTAALATASTVHAHPGSGAAERARQLLAHKAYVEHGQEELAAQAAAASRSHAAEEHPGVGLGTLVTSGNESARQRSGSDKRPSRPGTDMEIPLLAVTALAGLALGAAGSTASRRWRQRFGVAA